MALIKPFNAIRPKAGLEKDIAALPYDVYNRAEAKEVVSKNPLSFLNIDRAETQFDDSVDTYADCVYDKALELLQNMISNGQFVKDSAPFYYLYEQVMDGRAQTGLVCCASVLDYKNNIIKKHENTRADKEADRIRHVDTCNAQTGPIFLAFRNDDSIKSMFAKIKATDCLYSFTSDDGIKHTTWLIDSPEDIAFITDAFGKKESMYIADGHHRCASAFKVSMKRREEASVIDENAEYNFFLSVAFPDSELMIMDYNRVVKDLNGLSEEEFVSKLSEVFDISEKPYDEAKPSKKGEIFLLLGDKEYVLNVKPEFTSEDPILGLDVSILQNNILNPVLGIVDPKTDKRIDFVGGIRGVKELKRRIDTDCVVAFSMYPTSIQELFNVADAGLLMPPKSTWFEPKLRSGLFIHELS